MHPCFFMQKKRPALWKGILEEGRGFHRNAALEHLLAICLCSCYDAFVRARKQVENLCEPVAVRQKIIPALTPSRNGGKAIGVYAEKADRELPSRNIWRTRPFFAFTAANAGQEAFIKREKKYIRRKEP